MKLEPFVEPARFPALRIDPDEWVRFLVLAQKRGWSGTGGLRQLIEQYARKPFALKPMRYGAGNARTGWFSCPQEALDVLQAEAERLGVTTSDALRQLVSLALRAR